MSTRKPPLSAVPEEVWLRRGIEPPPRAVSFPVPVRISSHGERGDSRETEVTKPKSRDPGKRN